MKGARVVAQWVEAPLATAAFHDRASAEALAASWMVQFPANVPEKAVGNGPRT